jgi:hypothetical protein
MACIRKTAIVDMPEHVYMKTPVMVENLDKQLTRKKGEITLSHNLALTQSMLFQFNTSK